MSSLSDKNRNTGPEDLKFWRIESGEDYEVWKASPRDAEMENLGTSITVLGDATDLDTRSVIHINTPFGENEWNELILRVTSALGIIGPYTVVLSEKIKSKIYEGEV